MLGDMRDGVEDLPVRHPNIAPVHRKVRRNASVLGFHQLYTETITRIVSLVFTHPNQSASAGGQYVAKTEELTVNLVVYGTAAIIAAITSSPREE